VPYAPEVPSLSRPRASTVLIRPDAESTLSTVETAAEFSGSDRRTPTSPVSPA
jgi:hypothetical protein